METTSMTEDNDFYDMQWWCTNCGGEGEISFPESKTCEAAFIVCSHCSHPSAYGWCEPCGMGIQLEWIDFRQRPAVWHCERCDTEYKLPVDFYENPIRFQPGAFADIEKINERKFIREYGHVDVVWIKHWLLFWKKSGHIPLIVSGGLLLLLFSLVGAVQSSPPLWTRTIGVLLLAVFAITVLINLITFLISKVFLVVYKIGKKWNV